MIYLSPSDAPRFKWKCSYQGTVWYDCWDSTCMYEIELRRRADDYERKFYNGNDEVWHRDVVAAIGVLRRAHNSMTEVPAATLHAFNAWLLAEHNKWLDEMRAQPHRYGSDFSDIKPPFYAHSAARYVVGTGWIITEQATAQAA